MKKLKSEILAQREAAVIEKFRNSLYCNALSLAVHEAYIIDAPIQK
jgi:hypothetical protein